MATRRKADSYSLGEEVDKIVEVQKILEKVEVVKPQLIEKWRGWAVPEEIIEKALQQRKRARQTRKVEEKIYVRDYAYMLPRLPEIEAQRWGFAKVIDTEGHIDPRFRFVAGKVRKIDRWLYRWEYHRARIPLKTRSYDLTEEIANMMHIAVTIRRAWDKRIEAYAIEYETHAYSARAVRICYLIEPYLTVPEKKRRAKEILTIYKTRPSIPLK